MVCCNQLRVLYISVTYSDSSKSIFHDINDSTEHIPINFFFVTNVFFPVCIAVVIILVGNITYCYNQHSGTSRLGFRNWRTCISIYI